ncbi:MAG: ferritin family protein [Eubacteriales bacterium]|nr:ferritin family protein [Eubacteriales bacterium]
MNITHDGDAFFVACGMERRAVRMYERMRDLIKNDLILETLNELLKDEREHLVIFNSFLNESEAVSSHMPLLDAQADGILFAGGLTEAVRSGAVESRKALIDYAIEQEKIAIETYESFAKKCNSKAAQAFLQVADEEKRHLESLQNMREQE